MDSGYRLELGIQTERLLTMRLGLAERKYPKPEDQVAFYARLGERLNALPDVEAASVAAALPLGGGPVYALDVEAHPTSPGERAPEVGTVPVDPRYFETLTLTLRRGRSFNATDGTPGAEVAVVNERFAARDETGSGSCAQGGVDR